MNRNERYGPSIEALRTFLAVAECGNVTHAADRLGRTQSAVSVQIRKLEDGLNAHLFERRARGMALTADGRKLLPAARRTLSEVSHVQSMFAEPLHGRIRVGIPDDYDDTVLERALADFGQSHADVEIFARSGCTSRFVDAIRDNELDIAVISSPHATSGDVFSSEPTVWAASETFNLERDMPVPLAILDRDCWWRDMPANALEQCGRSWKIAYQSESFASLRAAVRAGLAVGTLPQSCIEAGMKVLSGKHGFPPLATANRVICISETAPADLTSAMADAIRKATVQGRNLSATQSSK